MENIALIESFSEFKDDKSIDRVTLMAILEDVFRSALKRKYGSDENFDIIINPDKGDLEIWRNRIVVENDEVEDDNEEISLSEAQKIEPDFEVGEEVSEEVKLVDLGRRAILALRQNLISKIHEHDNTNIFKHYKELEGELYSAEVHHVRHNAIILLDDNGNELVLPKSEQIRSDFFRKGESVRGIIKTVELPVTTIDPAEMNTISSEPQIIYFMKLAHKKFETFKKLPFLKGIRVVETVQFQHAFSGIIDESKKNKIDLIVMGSQGASGLQEMFIGSNTEKVVRKSTVPVLVIKKNIKNFDIKSMVFASDFNKESKSTFQRVIDFANIFDAKINLLYVNTIHNFNTSDIIEKRIVKFMKDFDFSDYTTNIYNDISIEKGILSFGRKINADLIALNTHGRSGLSQLFNGSVGQELANHALRPVVTFKI